jgi:hypothetical protein
MAKFAPVAPAHIVEQLSEAARGDYHLLLAHDIPKNAEVYKRVYNHFGFTIIMDNSVIELGNAVDLGLIKQAVAVTSATSIVLPDVMLDGKATVASCEAALDIWYDAFSPLLGYSNPWGFMYVPQGKTLEEFAASAEAFADKQHINFWGIPRNLVGQIGTRRDAIEVCRALNPQRLIHLLGFSDNLIDDVLCARHRYIRGIDSAVPLRAASEGTDISLAMKIGPRGNWWDEAKFVYKMNDNINTFSRWIRP